jgi:hypothetical protein
MHGWIGLNTDSHTSFIEEESLVVEQLTTREQKRTAPDGRGRDSTRPGCDGASALDYPHTNSIPQRRSIPICPRHARSAALLTLGSLSLRARCASPSDISRPSAGWRRDGLRRRGLRHRFGTDRRRGRPDAVSRTKVASWAQPMVPASRTGSRHISEAFVSTLFMGSVSTVSWAQGAQWVSSPNGSYPPPALWGKSEISRPAVLHTCTHWAVREGKLRCTSSTMTALACAVVPMTTSRCPGASHLGSRAPGYTTANSPERLPIILRPIGRLLDDRQLRDDDHESALLRIGLHDASAELDLPVGLGVRHVTPGGEIEVLCPRRPCWRVGKI